MNHSGSTRQIERIVLILLLVATLGGCGGKKEPGADDVRDPDTGVAEYLLDRRPGIDDGMAVLTAYYIADVKKKGEEHGEGVAVKLTYLDGRTVTRYFPEDVVRVGDMEAVATRVDEQGVRRVAVRVGPNEWKEIPPEQFALGNKNNPLWPWVHVAADQKLYPYGSRVFMPDAVGHEMVDGTIHDGYVWVADVGGAIKGVVRFDLFVGHADVYWKVLARREDERPNMHVVVDRLPDPPDGLDPWKTQGVMKILVGLGYSVDDGPDSSSSVKEALIDFQKKHKQIPEVEDGNLRAAITLWFLTQAAHQVAQQNPEEGDDG
jgi:hypothetical protein